MDTPPSRVAWDALPHLLLALVAVLVAARAVGALFRRLGQPPVIGEVVAGILLGPSLLGRLAPGASAFLFPAEVLPHLEVIAQAGVEPESQDTSYFANALISLASYYRRGIPNSPVKIDLAQARQLYFQAASAFGIPEAQFQLGRMMLTGEGGSVSVHQAKKWLNRARNNGHAGAMGLFGNIIFQEGDVARGLAFMTAALDHCLPKDCAWLQATQEEAFSVASEEDRRRGVALAQNIRFNPGD